MAKNLGKAGRLAGSGPVGGLMACYVLQVQSPLLALSLSLSFVFFLQKKRKKFLSPPSKEKGGLNM